MEIGHSRSFSTIATLLSAELLSRVFFSLSVEFSLNDTQYFLVLWELFWS
jgi:hypothetical protein